MTATDCGGCQGIGSHRRHCPAVIGGPASRRLRMAETVALLGDSCGSPEAASHLWRAAAVLRDEASLLSAQDR